MVLRLSDSWSNWNLEVLVFEERGKPEYPKKNLSEQRREPTTNSTHMWRRRQDLNTGHIGGRRALSPLRHPCSPCLWYDLWSCGNRSGDPAKKNLVTYNLIAALGPLKHHFLFQVLKLLSVRLSLYRYFITFSNYFQMTFQAKYRHNCNNIHNCCSFNAIKTITTKTKQIKQRIRHMQHYIIDRPKSDGLKTYASTSKSSTGSFLSEVKYNAD